MVALKNFLLMDGTECMSSLIKTTTTEYIQLQLILTYLRFMRSKLQSNGKNNVNGLILNGRQFDSTYSLDFINKSIRLVPL